MKKIILSVLVLSLAVAVQAQDGHRRHDRKRDHRGLAIEKLNLTEEQKSKFKSENEAFRKQMTELKKNENITIKEFKAKMGAIRKDHKSKIDGILTQEQKGQIEKMKTEQKEKHEKMMKAKGERMGEKLSLTEDQKAKMKSNREQLQSKMKAIRENKSLDESAKKEQMKNLMKENKESMKSILTEEQIKKMEEMRKSHDGMRKHRSDGKGKTHDGHNGMKKQTI